MKYPPLRTCHHRGNRQSQDFFRQYGFWPSLSESESAPPYILLYFGNSPHSQDTGEQCGAFRESVPEPGDYPVAALLGCGEKCFVFSDCAQGFLPVAPGGNIIIFLAYLLLKPAAFQCSPGHPPINIYGIGEGFCSCRGKRCSFRDRALSGQTGKTLWKSCLYRALESKLPNIFFSCSIGISITVSIIAICFFFLINNFLFTDCAVCLLFLPKKNLETFEKYDIIREGGNLCPALSLRFPVSHSVKTFREIVYKKEMYSAKEAGEILKKRFDYYLRQKKEFQIF